MTWVIAIHIKTTLDHNTEIETTTTGAVYDDLTQPTEDAATDLTMTHHTNYIADHPNIKAPQVIDPGITLGNIHKHPTDPDGMDCADQLHTPAGWEEDHILRRTWKLRLKTHTLIITALMITPVIWEKTQII